MKTNAPSILTVPLFISLFFAEDEDNHHSNKCLNSRFEVKKKRLAHVLFEKEEHDGSIFTPSLKGKCLCVASSDEIYKIQFETKIRRMSIGRSDRSFTRGLDRDSQGKKGGTLSIFAIFSKRVFVLLLTC